MARRAIARTARQELEPLVDAREEIARREHLRARRRELDRERVSVEPPHELRDRLSVVRVRREPPARERRAFGEEPRRVALVERQELEARLALDAKPLARRHDEPRPRRRPHPAREQLGRRRRHLLDVVDHDEHVPSPFERVPHVARRVPERRRHRRDERALRPRLRRRHEPHPREPFLHARGGLLGEPRLADPRRPEHRDDARLPREERGHALDVGRPPHEG